MDESPKHPLTEEGLIWRTTGPADLADHISQAAAFYRATYGRMPAVVWISPEMYDGRESIAFEATLIRIKPAEQVPLRELWLWDTEPAQ